MKRLLSLFIISILLLSSACGSRAVSKEATGSVAPATSITEPETTSATASATASATEPTSPAVTETTALEHDRPDTQPAKQICYRFATKEEGVRLMLSNQEYYDGFSQNDLEFRLQRVGATMEELKAFAREQVLDFTDEEKALIRSIFDEMETTLAENGYTLPQTDEVILIKTTMEEEKSAAGYTHGTQVYFYSTYIEYACTEREHKDYYLNYLRYLMWHELFHCMTRSNPDFQKDMYSIIHFTIVDEDFPIPPSVFEYHISNPDVEHHNSYATFRINGEDIDCFTDFVTTKHFEKPGDSFFDFCTTALVPIDGTDIYYTPEQAENYDEGFGKNTGYVVDPEECIADNFTYAMQYGMSGENGNGYPNPEIIAAILEYLSR